MAEEWAAQSEEIALQLLSDMSASGGAYQLLLMSNTNRTIISRKQAIILATLRFAANYYRSLYPKKKDSYKWIDDLCDIIEGYQLTMVGDDNSRRQFMKVEMARLASMVNRDKKNEKPEDVIK